MATINKENLIQLWKKIKLYVEDKLVDYVSTEQLAQSIEDYFENNNIKTEADIRSLTFTGAVTAEYDGSQPVTIEIPEGFQITDEQVKTAVFEYLADNPVRAGVTTEQANSLWAILQKTAFTQALTDAEISAFKTAWGIDGTVEPDTPVDPAVILSSISATYTGGDVATGTAVTDLTGITVTATYSDGTTATVTGYTLSGDIVEGSNTITVSYGGKTTTFTVTGIVESGGETTAELITDGLLAFFDFRTIAFGAVGTAYGCPTPTQGTGALFSWQSASSYLTEEQGEYGVKMARAAMYSADGTTTQTDFGTEFTVVELQYGQAGGSGVQATNLVPRWQIRPVYNNTSGGTTNTTATSGNALNGDAADDYNFMAYRVNGKDCTVMFDTSVMNYNGDDYEDFSSWESKTTYGRTMWGQGYGTAVAFYNRALTDVEIEEMRAFFKTLEVA